MGGGVDDFTNTIFYDENEIPQDGVAAGDATSGGILGVLAGVGVEAILGKK